MKKLNQSNKQNLIDLMIMEQDSLEYFKKIMIEKDTEQLLRDLKYDDAVKQLCEKHEEVSKAEKEYSSFVFFNYMYAELYEAHLINELNKGAKIDYESYKHVIERSSNHIIEAIIKKAKNEIEASNKSFLNNEISKELDHLKSFFKIVGKLKQQKKKNISILKNLFDGLDDEEMSKEYFMESIMYAIDNITDRFKIEEFSDVITQLLQNEADLADEASLTNEFSTVVNSLI